MLYILSIIYGHLSNLCSCPAKEKMKLMEEAKEIIKITLHSKPKKTERGFVLVHEVIIDQIY